MTNQSSIKYISTLLASPDTLTEGDQNSIALFRQTFPYFVPTRYFVALENHKKTAYSPAMLSAIVPYMGNWQLFCDFLKAGTSSYKYMPGQKAAGAFEHNVSKPASSMADANTAAQAVKETIEQKAAPVPANEPVAKAAEQEQSIPPLNFADNPFIVLDAGSEYINDLVNRQMEQSAAPGNVEVKEEQVTPPVVEFINEAPQPEIEAARNIFEEATTKAEETIAAKTSEVDEVTQPAAPVVVADAPVAAPAERHREIDERHFVPLIPVPVKIVKEEPAIAVAPAAIAEEPVATETIEEVKGEVSQPMGVAPAPVVMANEDVPVNSEAAEPEPDFADEAERIAAVKKAVEEEWKQRVGIGVAPAAVNMSEEAPETSATAIDEPVGEITEKTEAANVEEPAAIEENKNEEVTAPEVNEEIDQRQEDIPGIVEEHTVVSEEETIEETRPTLIVETEETVVYETIDEDALEIINETEETTLAETAADKRDYDPLIFPIYTKDYFLQQGERVSEEIPFEISELKDNDAESEEDKSLMVVMSFSEWLLHFKNSAEKQIEESKDQRALKTMWQKEKLAAAMEEENEEIPENVFEMAVNSISKEEGLVSDTLAEIYIKQGKYDKAIEMYRKLSLRNPQKNVYFARKIEEALKDKQS